MELHTIGMILVRQFHLVGLNLHGEVVVRKKFSRIQLLRFAANVLGSGMAVEVTHFRYLFHARERITVGYSHRAHETRPIPVQEIHGDGVVAVVRILVGLRANNEGCRGDKLYT